MVQKKINYIQQNNIVPYPKSLTPIFFFIFLVLFNFFLFFQFFQFFFGFLLIGFVCLMCASQNIISIYQWISMEIQGSPHHHRGLLFSKKIKWFSLICLSYDWLFSCVDLYHCRPFTTSTLLQFSWRRWPAARQPYTLKLWRQWILSNWRQKPPHPIISPPHLVTLQYQNLNHLGILNVVRNNCKSPN